MFLFQAIRDGCGLERRRYVIGIEAEGAAGDDREIVEMYGSASA
jgi:hypothetical protein